MHEKRLSYRFTLLAIAILLTILALFIRSFITLDYQWDFSILLPYLWDSTTNGPGLFLQGLWTTFLVSLASIVLGSIGGIVLGLLLCSREPVSRKAVLIFVDIVRNTPVLVQLYLAYFVIGTAFQLSAEHAGILTLSVFCSSYVAEIFRGTWVNFERGQIEAAKSMGLSPWQVFYIVIFPQAVRRMLPPLVGQFVSLVKDSSLVSVIGITELTKAGLSAVSASFRTFEIWFTIAAFYLIINTVLSSLGRYLEHRLSVSLRH